MPSSRNRTLTLTAEERRVPPPRLEGPAEPDHAYAADAVEGLNACPPADLVFADPPYDAKADFHERWIDAAARVLRPGGSLYVCCDWRFSGLVQSLLSRLLKVRNRITWRREKGRGAARNWKQNMEDVWFATKGDAYTFNVVKWRKPVVAPYREKGRPKDWTEDERGRFRMTSPSNLWNDLCVPFWSMPENTEHPYQKPEKLLQRVIEASSRPGDLVVDPFLGSGTTAVVAARLGRRWIGFEREARWVLTALKRLRERP
jgi:DNA modification methylase